MKKLIFILLIFLNVGLFAQFSGGSGTSASPYLISTPLQLDSIRNHKGSYFLVTNDIDLTSYTWLPIDTMYCNFDGGGHSIKNLTYSHSVTDINSVQGSFINYLIGNFNLHHVRFSHLNVTVYNGEWNGVIIGSSHTATGVILDSVIVDSSYFKYYDTGARNEVYTGGILGWAGNTSLTRSAVTNSIIIDSIYFSPNPYGGTSGLVGLGNVTISQCFTQHNVFKAFNYGGGGNINCAGLAGYVNGSITDSYSNNKFFGNNSSSSYIAGAIGFPSSVTLTRVYVIDSLITSESSTNKGTFYSQGSSFPSGNMDYCDVTVSYGFGFIENPADTGSHYVSDASMKLQSTYSGWNFNTVWGISSLHNGGYPYLNWTVFFITNPYAGQMNTVGDSVLLKISSPTTDTLISYINYGNGFDSLGLFVDSAKFQVDTAGLNVQFKVIDKPNMFSVLSGVFQVYPVRTLILDSVYSYSSLDFIVIHSGVLNTTSYYSPDSINWTKLGTNSFGYSLKKDTLPYSITFGMGGKSYFKIVELYDTSTYDFTPATYLSGYSPVPNVLQNCYNWQYSGFGAVWLRDVSCGWTSGIYQEAGYSTVNISSIGEATVIPNFIVYLETSSQAALIACCYPSGTFVTWITDRTITPVMPTPESSNFATTSASNPVAINGREFWWVNNILYQRDLVNGLTTQIYNLSYSMGLAGNFTGPVGVAIQGNLLLFASLPGYGYPDVIILNALPYPPLNNYEPLSSEYTAIGPLNYFRNSLRGISPKGITSFYPPLGH